MRTLYRARRVHTLAYPTAGDWLLVDERHVERVGTGDPPAADRVVDLPGATIVPGFIDSHVHLTGTGLSVVGIPIERSRSKGDLLGLVAEELKHGPSRVFAHGFDETMWESPQLPTLAELDELGDVPIVLVRTDGHLSLANSAALIAAEAEDEEGVDRDEHGRPSGVVRRDANHRLQRWFHDMLSDHELRDLQLGAAARAAARGVTAVYEMATPASRGRRDVEALLSHRERLPIDVVPYVADTDIAYVMDLGLETIGGDLSLDGSIGARTAAVSEPYEDGYGFGILYRDPAELTGFFSDAHHAGLQVAVHAIGDAAIGQALDAWEHVYAALDSRGRRHFRARRNRIEHFEMAWTQQVERAAILGLAISIQPAFDLEWGHAGAMYEQRLGEERASRMNRFAELVGRGVTVGAGSDSPITELDPMLGTWALESHHEPDQRLTREQAIRLYTIGSATIGNLEDKKGRLEPGMQADFAAFEADPFTIEDPRGVRPILTVSRGREVYSA